MTTPADVEHVEQQMPTPNDRPSIQSMVRADLEHREQVGIQRYGTPLQAHNGRNAVRDAYEEALDLAVYLRQVLEEWPVDALSTSQLVEVKQGFDDRLADVRAAYTRAGNVWDQERARLRADIAQRTRVIEAASEALANAGTSCRFHGIEYERSGIERGEPRCDSCKQPYRVHRALMAIAGHEGGW